MRNLRSFFLFLAVLYVIPAFSRAQSDVFFVSKNAFIPGQETVSIQVAVGHYPSEIGLRIYNSAGELVKILDKTNQAGAFSQTYTWDGTNVHGDKVASGVYLIHLETSFYTHTARVMVTR